MRKPLKDRPNGFTEYLLKRIPVNLWRTVQAKGKAEDPPLTMRWIILACLIKYRDNKITIRKGADGDGRIPGEVKPVRPYKPKPLTITQRRIGKYKIAMKRNAKARRLAAPDVSEMF